MKIRASVIAERLTAAAEQVASMCLPNGKRQGQFWVAGNVSGDEGKSLKVYLSGPKSGRWQDYASGEKGDLLDLWAMTKGQSIADAMRDAAEWLGIKHEPVKHPTQHPKRKYQSPAMDKLQDLSLSHVTYLKSARFMDDKIVRDYGVRSEGDSLAFVYYGLDGKPFGIKYRTVEKKMWSAPNCRPGLYGWNMIPDRVRSVVLVEGELDAIALAHYEIPALSVPNGGGGDGKQSHWVEEEYDNLNRFDTIYLTLDMDDSGKAAMAEIMDRLGADRCRIVDLPHNDPNDCLREGVTRDEMRECFRASRCIDPDELRKPSDYIPELEDEFHGVPDSERGFGPPFIEISSELRFRDAEVIIVGGPNGSGKSQYAGHQMLEAMNNDHRVCIASMEFKPPRYLARLLRQASTLRQPSKAYIRHIAEWMDENLWVFDVTGTAKVSRMLEVFEYARRRYGVKVFLIDNLAKCGFDEDDYNGQKGFVDLLTDFAKEHDATVFLVHHMKKGGEGKLGIKGSGGITDMADTVLTVWRNHDKERHLDECNFKNIPPDEEIASSPDGIIDCVKQRNGESEPTKAAWFHRDSFQFLSRPTARPFCYCPEFSKRAAA